MPIKSILAGLPSHITQDQHHDDGVIRVSNDWDEIGHEVNGQKEVDEKETKPDSNFSRHLIIAGQSPNEANDIWRQTEGVHHADLVRLAAGYPRKCSNEQ
jgi:hypothetical protein